MIESRQPWLKANAKWRAKRINLESFDSTTTTTAIAPVRKLEKFFCPIASEVAKFQLLYLNSIESTFTTSCSFKRKEIQSLPPFPMWSCLCHTTRTKYEPIKVFGNVIIPAWNGTFSAFFFIVFFIAVLQQQIEFCSLQLSVVSTAVNVKNNAK